MEPTAGTVAPIVDTQPAPRHATAETARVRAGDTVAPGSRDVWGPAADHRSGMMTRADLLTVVKSIRDERGQTHDTAAHLLLTEVACLLEWDSTAAWADLLARVRTLREERSRSHDPVLMLLLGEIIAALQEGPPVAKRTVRGYCEFCGTDDGGCAVCGGD